MTQKPRRRPMESQMRAVLNGVTGWLLFAMGSAMGTAH